MYTDLPKFTRCCFCLPLRYGLLVWGCIKIILTSLNLLFLSMALAWHLQYVREHPEFSRRGVPPPVPIMMTLSLVEIMFDVTLVYAAYKKNEKLFRVYYYYSVFVLVLITIGFLFSVGASLVAVHRYMDSYAIILAYSAEIISSLLGIIFIQVYVTLLVRTEMVKLRDNCKFEFVNNQTVAEAQCSVQIPIV